MVAFFTLVIVTDLLKHLKIYGRATVCELNDATHKVTSETFS